MARFRCTACNWVNDEKKEGIKFAEQPDSYTCPNCGAPKSAFVPEGFIRSENSTDSNVAEKIVEQLIALGIEHIYGIPGDSNLPLIEALRKDGRLKNIKKEQAREGYPMFGVSFPNPDYSKFAQSCGGEGFRVKDPKKLDGVLTKAFSLKKPCIIEIMVSSEKLTASGKRLK